MCIVARRCSEAAVLVEAAEDEVDHAIAWECFRMAEEMESRQSPVDAADAEVFCEMVFELVAALLLALVVSEGGREISCVV
jgi:hypothetical protein